MENKQLQIVNFEQAKQLKNVGFGWDTRCFYKDQDGKVHHWGIPYKMNHNNGEHPNYTSAPTVALALKWMREVKNIVCGVQMRDDRARGDAPYVGVYEWGDNESFYASDSVNHTHEATESALLDELLTLIEK